jgi:hypothetical protein
MAPTSLGVRGMGTEIGAALCLGGREQPRLYSVCDPAVINISLTNMVLWLTN